MFAVIKLFLGISHGCRTTRRSMCFQWGSVPLRSGIKGMELPLPIFW